MKKTIILNRSVFFAFLFSFLFILPVKNFAQNKVIDEIVAIVGKNPILLSEIEYTYLQYAQNGIELDKCEILEGLLINKLLLLQAELDSIVVSDSEVEIEMDNRLNNWIAMLGSVEKLEKNYGRSLNEIKDEIRVQIHEGTLIQRMRGTITRGVTITPSEIRKFYKNIPKDKIPYVTSKIEINQIVKYPGITDAEILRVKEKLRGFRQRIIDSTASFSTLAIMYSEDPGSKLKGGKYEDQDRTLLAPEFAAAAFKLKPGEISNVVKTQFGYHIIQLHDRKGDRITYSHILLFPKVENSEIIKTKNELDSIADLIRNGKISFEDAAKKYSEDETTKESGGRITNNYDLSTILDPESLDPDINQAFKDLKLGEISEPFKMYDLNTRKEAYKIIFLKSKSKPHLANLKEDYQLIQDSTLNIKRQDVIDNWIMEKQKTHYIKIDDSFKNCTFKYDSWIKK
ncbi:peptidylprolyl isomerase [Bacteroidota bacterium]